MSIKSLSFLRLLIVQKEQNQGHKNKWIIL